MLTLLLASVTFAQTAPLDLADDPSYERYVESLLGVGGDVASPTEPVSQIWDGTVSVRSAEGIHQADVFTVAVDGGYHHVERWVVFDPAAQETMTSGGFSLRWVGDGASWSDAMDVLEQEPGWQDYGYAELDLYYKTPPTQQQVDGVMAFQSPGLQLFDFAMFQPGNAAPVGYLLRERRVVDGEIEWVDHWMLDGWQMLSASAEQGSVLPTSSTYTTVKAWLQEMQAHAPESYARVHYALGTLDEAP